jgi:hypothetical protein
MIFPQKQNVGNVNTVLSNLIQRAYKQIRKFLLLFIDREIPPLRQKPGKALQVTMVNRVKLPE